jgi:hypothetical protein
MKTTIIFFLLSALYQIELFSQASTNESVVDLKTFGIGMGFITPIFIDYDEPFANIILTMNLKEKFRFEPEFGFAVKNYEEKGVYSTKRKMFLFAINGLAIIKSNRTGLLLGAKLGYSKDYSQYHQQNFDPGESDENSFFIGPVIGLEYFISQYFSITGEFDALYLRARGYVDEDNEITGNTYKSRALLKFHFYF